MSHTITSATWAGQGRLPRRRNRHDGDAFEKLSTPWDPAGHAVVSSAARAGLAPSTVAIDLVPRALQWLPLTVSKPS